MKRLLFSNPVFKDNVNSAVNKCDLYENREMMRNMTSKEQVDALLLEIKRDFYEKNRKGGNDVWLLQP